MVVVYNSLGWKREEVVRVPVSTLHSPWLISEALTLSLVIVQYYVPLIPALPSVCDNFY